tara:strand:+ start:262 stop:522 length:261 start_codon:yes stop_codon:yes gene_type:complete
LAKITPLLSAVVAQQVQVVQHQPQAQLATIVFLQPLHRLVVVLVVVAIQQQLLVAMVEAVVAVVQMLERLERVLLHRDLMDKTVAA